MNTETRNAISRAAELLRGHLTVIEANQALITAEKAVAAVLNDQKIQLESRGGAGADQLPALMAQINQNLAATDKLLAKHEDLLQSLNSELHPIYPVAKALLADIHTQRISALSEQLRHCCSSNEEARETAVKSPACQRVRKDLVSIGAGPRDRAANHAQIILQYFDEALQAS